MSFDLVGELALGVRDRAAAWRFIERFAAEWASPLTPGDGTDEAELAAAEERLGLRLPAAMREAYTLFGRRKDLTSNQDDLLSPADLHVHESGEALVFRAENQEVAYWGVPLADLDAEDPPVAMWVHYEEPEPWAAWLDRFSVACLEIVLSESLNAVNELLDFRDQTEDDLALLEQRYTRLAIPEYPLSEPGQGAHWFAGPDVVIRADGLVWMRVRTEDRLEPVRESLPGEWEYAAEYL